MSKQFWNPSFHIEPRQGWLNDPNGLCQFRGRYHAYYQYAPNWPTDELKYWGHVVSDDLISWEDLGVALAPDIQLDRSGVFSGCTWVDKGGAPDGGDLMRVFYTGNVVDTFDDERVDWGREANQIMTTSENGLHFSPKKALLTNADYPASCTLHVRDPKVWEQDGCLHMLLGARQRGPLDTDNPDARGDFGSVLVYDSHDKGESWQLRRTILPKNAAVAHLVFGYMWECPNVIRMGDREFLAVCPQGLPSESYRWQNLWQAGYFPLPEHEKIIDIDAVPLDNFTEWDHGFDFYAPQIFADERGRTISIGWMGTFDHSYTSVPEGMDRAHTMTLPREITLGADGLLRQWPVTELDNYRGEARALPCGKSLVSDSLAADVILKQIEDGDAQIWLNDVLEVFVESGSFGIRFAQTEAGALASAGRQSRSIRLESLDDLRMIVDGSTIEIYVNGGAEVFSTRWFPLSDRLTIRNSFRARSSFVYPLIKPTR